MSASGQLENQLIHTASCRAMNTVFEVATCYNLPGGTRSMTISISPETETLLRKQAKERGATETELAESILYGVLIEDFTGDLNDADAIREAIEQEREGRYRPFSEYVAEHRARYRQSAR
jgi:hypothetical protein